MTDILTQIDAALVNQYDRPLVVRALRAARAEIERLERLSEGRARLGFAALSLADVLSEGDVSVEEARDEYLRPYVERAEKAEAALARVREMNTPGDLPRKEKPMPDPTARDDIIEAMTRAGRENLDWTVDEPASVPTMEDVARVMFDAALPLITAALAEKVRGEKKPDRGWGDNETLELAAHLIEEGI